MRIFCVLALMLFGLMAATPARADLDQMCLRNCVQNGGNSTACMPKCTYGAIPPAKAPQGSFGGTSLSPHRVLDTPTPAGNALVQQPKPAGPAPEKDYPCFNSCLQGGGAYQMCERRCAVRTCTPGTGSIGCSNLKGAVNGNSRPGIQ